MSLRTMLRRVLRLRCPACGHGHLYRRYFVRKEICGHCGWNLERDPGHWVGGSEVHMFASYGLSVVLFVPVLVLAPPGAWILVGVIAGHLVLSILLFRFTRAFFLGFDYLLDPGAPPDDDGLGGIPGTLRTPTPPSGARRRRERVCALR